MSDQSTRFGRENWDKIHLMNTPVATTMPGVNSESSSPSSDSMEDESPNNFMTYVRQLAGRHEIIDVVMLDHSYARPWNWLPQNEYVKPAKKIFFSKLQSTNSEGASSPEEFIDVENGDPEPKSPPCDLSQARQAMDEFQRVANFVRPEDTDDWEEKIDKILWSPVQNRIFSRIVRILNSERIARLSKSNTKLEPIVRRTFIDNTSRKFRETMGSANWDLRITQWLHGLLFDYLPQDYLAIYLDILQTLRQKIPQLIDKMIAIQPNINFKGSSLSWETLGPLLKKSWDPVSPELNSCRMKNLKANPILIVIPNGLPTNISTRHQKFIAQLGALGMAVTVNPQLTQTASRMTMIAGTEQLVQAARLKIQEVRVAYPGTPIFLIGLNTGAAVACKVALLEYVTAIVCLGFPLNTVDGNRGNPDDTLLDVRVPVMFIIGQNAIQARIDDVEDLRERMLAATNLVVVGSADDQLRISTTKKITERISQSMVDRCILGEIRNFLGGVLANGSLPVKSANSLGNYENRNKKAGPDGRKRRISTSSSVSVDSEPPSPSIKKFRDQLPQLASANHGQRMPVSTNALPRGTLVPLTGTTATQTPKRKPRVSYANQNYPDQLITSRLTPQQQSMDNSTGGITLNIGSFASLAPVGPIRFEPASINLQSSAAVKAGINTLKTTNTFIKVSKNNQVNIGGQQQSVAKIKMLLPTKKPGQRTYKNPNLTDKTGEINMVNVLSPTSTGIRVSAPAGTVTNMKTPTRIANTPPLPSFHLARSSANGTVIGIPVTSANVVFTPKSSVPVTTTVSTTMATAPKALPTVPTKVADIAISGCSRKYSMIHTSSTNQLDQASQSSLIGTGAPTKERSQKFGFVPTISLKKLPGPQTKAETSENGVKKRLQNDVQFNETPQMTPSSLDDDLGNILDIPIIIAKDGENLNNLEHLSPLPQTVTPVTLQSSEVKSLPVINAVGNKVVFINNKSLISSTDAVSSTNTMTLSRPGLTTQPTIKYTKIILTKKPEHEDSQRSNPVLLTKAGRRTNNFVVLDPKSEVKYAQTVTRFPANYLGELQTNENVVGPQHNSNVQKTKEGCIELNVENGEKP
ncbi:hypothetical protein TSAR_002472 [Trichomalopsis sarcophagae]|uniref:KANL3/Tex30 alpha/beta hydrolase-like domain-containing protein n=1 Tax=Trichomalopsis sarcophagae TaxID=543379 RepID=A0A232F5Z2_9HYME|nr:hypothetical protein TSAR_002472 [Trichomalopsis sarcophagae]